MENIKRYIVINQFEEGWDIFPDCYEDILMEYCTDALFIPKENIKETVFHNDGLEIHLSDLSIDDLSEDWFTNLQKTANYISDI